MKAGRFVHRLLWAHDDALEAWRNAAALLVILAALAVVTWGAFR